MAGNDVPHSQSSLDDEFNSGHVSVRLSAIHALMAISEPMGYNNIFVPRLDESDWIIGQDLGELDDQVSLVPNADRRFTEYTIDPSVAQMNSNSSQQMRDSDNKNIQRKNQIVEITNTKGRKGLFAAFKPVVESHTRIQNCRVEGCSEKSVVISPEEHSGINGSGSGSSSGSGSGLGGKNDDDEDRVYHHSLYCKKHLLGSRKCEFDGCDKCAQGSTKFCIKHGGKQKCE